MNEENKERTLRKKLTAYEEQEAVLIAKQRRVFARLEDVEAKGYHYLTQLQSKDEYIAQAIQASQRMKQDLSEQVQREQKRLVHKQDILREKLKKLN